MSYFRNFVRVVVCLILNLGASPAWAVVGEPPGPSRLERVCEAALDGIDRAVAEARRFRREFEFRHAAEIAGLRVRTAVKLAELRGDVRARWDRLVRAAPPQVAQDLRRFERVWRDSTTAEILVRRPSFRMQTASFLDFVRASFGRGEKRVRANERSLNAMSPSGILTEVTGRANVRCGRGVDDALALRMVDKFAPYLSGDDVFVIRVESPGLLFVAGQSLPTWFEVGNTIIVHGMLVHGWLTRVSAN